MQIKLELAKTPESQEESVFSFLFFPKVYV